MRPARYPINKRKVEYRTDSREAYNLFRKEHPDIEIDVVKWRNIIRTHNELFANYLLDTGERVHLRSFGTFTITRKRSSKSFEGPNGKVYINLPVDWKKSKELGKKVYLFNSHSDGNRYIWKWFRSDSRIFAYEIWYFKPIRRISRKLAEYIRMGTEQQEKYKNWNRKSIKDLT